jgi:hypothetical protein
MQRHERIVDDLAVPAEDHWDASLAYVPIRGELASDEGFYREFEMFARGRFS